MIFVLFLIINSCKKELYNGEKKDPKRLLEMLLQQKNAPKVEIINLTQFKNKANLNALGTLNQQFVAAKSKVMSVNTAETYLGFNIITDSIKVIKDRGHTMYIFPVALASKKARSFQNLTIDESAAGTVAFVNTYTPTKKWLHAWKKGHPGKFDGEINVTYLDLKNGYTPPIGISKPKGKNSNTVAVAQICNTTSYYYEIPFMCGSGQHNPGEECSLTGDARAGYLYVWIDITTCYDDPNPSGGGGGGGGTTPTPPPGYDPCDEGPNEPPIVSSKKPQGNKVMVVPPSDCDEEADESGDPLQGFNKLCSSSFNFSQVVAPGDGSRGWKEASVKVLTINVMASNFFEHIWNTIVGGTVGTFSLTIGVPGDLPSANVSKESGIAVNKAMVDIYRSYGYEGVKNLINTGQKVQPLPS